MSRVASPPTPAESSFEFRGRGGSLLALWVCHLLAIAVAVTFAAWLVLAVVDRVAPKAGEWLHFWRLPLYAAIAGLALASIALAEVAEAIDLYRIRHTYVHGRPLDCTEGCMGFGQPVLNSLITLVTLGLGGPWVKARKVHYQWRCTHFRTDSAVHFDHNGPVGEWYLLWLLFLICAPLGTVTFGLLTVAVMHVRIRWEQAHIRVPGPGGQMHQARYSGTWTGYLGVLLPGFLLTLVTLGIYAPWAAVARWRWISGHTHVPAVAHAALAPERPARANWLGIAWVLVPLLGCAALMWGLAYMPQIKAPKPPRKRSTHITVCPMPANSMPRSQGEFVAALQGGMNKILAGPAGWRPVSAQGRKYPELEQVRIDVSGANITPEKHFPKSIGKPLSLDDDVNIKRMFVAGNPLMYQQAKLSVEMTAENVWLGVEADNDGRPVLVVNEAWDGRLAMTMKLTELEGALLAALRPEAQKYSVTLEKAQLSLKAMGPKTLDVQVKLTAKYGLRATVVMAARIDIDEQLNAKFTNLNCTGDGATGTLLVGIAKPVLQKYEGFQASLTGAALGGIQLRDLVLSTDDALHVQAGFGEKGPAGRK